MEINKIFEKGYVDQQLLLYTLNEFKNEIKQLKESKNNYFSFNEKKSSEDFYLDWENNFYIILDYEPINKNNILILNKEIVNGKEITNFIDNSQIIKIEENKLYLKTEQLNNSIALYITYQY